MKRSLKYCEFYEDFDHSITSVFTCGRKLSSQSWASTSRSLWSICMRLGSFWSKIRVNRLLTLVIRLRHPGGLRKEFYVQMITWDPTITSESRRATSVTTSHRSWVALVKMSTLVVKITPGYLEYPTILSHPNFFYEEKYGRYLIPPWWCLSHNTKSCH